MLEVVMLVANSVAAEVLQLIAGYIFAAAICLVFCRLPRTHSFSKLQDLLIILFMSAIGMALPFSGFAVVPIIVVLVGIGYPLYAILPMLFSNFMFNMLVPITDVSFTWHNGFRLVMLSFAVGILAGIVFKHVLSKNRFIVSQNAISNISLGSTNFIDVLKSFISNMNIIMPYLLIGVAANALFQNLAFMGIMSWVNTGPIGTIIPIIFKGYDITTPVFLLAMSILTMLMNLRNLSVLALIFKFKGIFIYYVYFVVWILILSIANFFVG